MATIKTQLVSGQRRIITKIVNGQKKISCSCCPPVGCCLYDSIFEGSLFTTDDLPDEWILGEAFGPPLISQKNIISLSPPLSYSAYSWTTSTENFRIVKTGTSWQMQRKNISSDSYSSSTTTFCLDILGSDNFEDTYTISITVNNITSSVVVTRESLCFWRGEEFTDGGGSNRLLSLVWVTFPTIISGGITIQQTWAVEDAGRGLYPKDGFLNNPIGTYGINVSVA